MKLFVALKGSRQPLRVELSVGAAATVPPHEPGDESTPVGPDPEFSLYAIERLIDQARAEIGFRLGNADSHDAKALGVAAAEAAALFALATFRDHLNRWWWVLIFGVVASICSLLMVVRNRDFPVGPDVGEFYERHIGEHPLALGLALLTDLQVAVDECLASLRPKTWCWRVGMGLLILTAVGGSTCLLVVH